VVPQPMSSYVEFPDLIGKFGLLPIAFSFIGTVVLIIKGGKKNIGLVLGLGLLLIVFLVFIRFHYGLSTIYERGLTAMLLILSILAGAGLFWLRKLRLPREFLEKHKSVLLANAAVIACVILTVVILVIAIPARASAVFYHMIDDEDYRAFTWTKDNIGAEYDTALLDPWKATAFTAITGRNVASRIWFQTEPVDAAIYRFLADGCEDNIVFQDFGGTLVYNLTPCNNPDVIEVRHNIYITNPGSLSALGPRNILRNAGFAPIYGAPPVFWSTYLQNCKAIFAYPQPGRAGDSSIGIRITGIEGANPIPAALWSQRVPVQAGKSYTIGGWIRTEDVTGQDGAMIMPQWKGPSYSWISVTGFMPYIRGTGDWTYYIGRVTAPAGAEFCDVCCIMTDCTGSSWFNDILFEEEK